jgi:Flp pilus assembly protein TadB
MADNPTTDGILKKYGAKIEKQMKGFNKASALTGGGDGSGEGAGPVGQYSQSYERFKAAMIPSFTRYEKWCKALGNVFHMKVGEKDKKKIDRSIEIAHLNLSASEVVVFATMALFLSLFGGLLITVGGWFLFTEATLETFPMMLSFLIFLLSVFLFFYSVKTPERLAMQWRLKASSQMVPAILYIVIYMKHTSNFEKAIAFASQHLEEPLSLDFRKIFWDVEVGKFSTIKDSVDSYLETWRDYSLEFIEAFHLIESSLYEPNEGRRVAVLEKSLQVILDGVYDKMLKYTHNVKAPLTNIYMLGIVLPTLALAILPLASTMLQGAIKWYHVLLLFNIIIPLLVLYMTGGVMMKRPGGYGETSLLEKNPLYAKYKSKKPYLIASLMMFPLFLIGLVPLLWRYTNLPMQFGLARDYTWSSIGLGFLGNGGIFGILDNGAGVLSGPHGALALIMSLFIPLSVAFMFVIAYNMKTKSIIGSRDQYKEVEREFTSSLFQLGNRIGDGLPAEIAFSKVAESSKGTATEGFFRVVNQNIHQLGMSLERALFDQKRGAVIFYPSQLVATSMKILVESVKKGLQVAARSLMSISEYVKNIRKIQDRLNDLLADIISDMKSNMTFLAPLLSGIIVGLAGMISTILGALYTSFEGGAAGEGIGGIGEAGGLGGILSIFDPNLMMPTYWLQIVVGIYLIEIVFILSGTLVTIKSGRDKLQTTAETATNLKRAMLLYFIVALGAIVGLTLVGAIALAGLG